MVISSSEVNKKLREKAAKLEEKLEEELDAEIKKITGEAYVSICEVIPKEDYNSYVEEILDKLKRRYEVAGWEISDAELTTRDDVDCYWLSFAIQLPEKNKKCPPINSQ